MSRVAALAFCLVAAGWMDAQSSAPVDAAINPATRIAQLIESTAVAVPGLIQASEVLRRNTEQTVTALRESPEDPALVYRLMNQAKAYLALSDSVPRPVPFPSAAEQQFSELREESYRLERMFEASLTAQGESARRQDSDPAGRARYAEENSRLPPPGNLPRVVFLGDSIIEGWRLNEYFTGREFLNRGIAEQTTLQMIGRFLQDVAALRPRMVVIEAGTNDIARGVSTSAVQDNLTVLGDLAKTHGVKPIFGSILPVGDYHRDLNPRFEMTRSRSPAAIQQINRWLEQYCSKESFGYLDFYKALADASGQLPADLSDDGLHPNAKAYRIMAPIAIEGLNRALAMLQAPVTGAPAKRRSPLPR